MAKKVSGVNGRCLPTKGVFAPLFTVEGLPYDAQDEIMYEGRTRLDFTPIDEFERILPDSADVFDEKMASGVGSIEVNEWDDDSSFCPPSSYSYVGMDMVTVEGQPLCRVLARDYLQVDLPSLADGVPADEYVARIRVENLCAQGAQLIAGMRQGITYYSDRKWVRRYVVNTRRPAQKPRRGSWSRDNFRTTHERMMKVQEMLEEDCLDNDIL